MQIKPQQIKQSSITIDLEISQPEIAEAKTKALKTLGKSAAIKGFRPGKAPLSLLDQNLDPDKVKHQTLHQLLDKIIPKIIADQKLKLVGNPQLSQLNNPSDKPWTITLNFPLLPKINLGNYKKLIKENIAKDKSKFNKLNRDQKINQILDILLKNIDFEIPQSLIDQEVNRSLSRLIEQTQSLGLTIEKYLTSINKTVENVKNEYFQKALESLKTELILLEIAKDRKVNVTQTEIDKFIKGIGDQKIIAKLKSDSERPFLESLLLKRFAIDELLKI